MLKHAELGIRRLPAMRVKNQCFTETIRQKLHDQTQLLFGKFVHPACKMKHCKRVMLLIREIDFACRALLEYVIGLNTLRQKRRKFLDLGRRKLRTDNKIHRQQTLGRLIGDCLNLGETNEDGGE